MSTTAGAVSGDHADLDVITDAAGPYLNDDERQQLARDRGSRRSDPLEELRRVRALSELLQVNEERAVERASADGRTQREIAAALGKPQTQVHRILRRARLSESEARTPAREVILQYKSGAITQGMMIGLLRGAAEGSSAGGQHDDGYAPDDWDEIRSAYMTGLLTEAEYEELRHGTAHPGARRRR